LIPTNNYIAKKKAVLCLPERQPSMQQVINTP